MHTWSGHRRRRAPADPGRAKRAVPWHGQPVALLSSSSVWPLNQVDRFLNFALNRIMLSLVTWTLGPNPRWRWCRVVLKAMHSLQHPSAIAALDYAGRRGRGVIGSRMTDPSFMVVGTHQTRTAPLAWPNQYPQIFGPNLTDMHDCYPSEHGTQHGRRNSMGRARSSTSKISSPKKPAYAELARELPVWQQ